MTDLKKTNILLITTDTHRTDALRCMGSEFAISPNLDRLANEGVLFMQAHTSSPVCMPARCSLMTGMHTPMHGCIENGIDRREDVIMLPDVLKENGYVNIMVGKTHFGKVPDSFDIQFVTKGEKNQDSDDCYGQYIKEKGYSRVSKHPNMKPEELCIDSYLIDKTIESIDRVKDQDKPFFAFCSLLSPHGPIDPPGKWANLYDDIELPQVNLIEGEIKNQPKQQKDLLGLEDTKKNQKSKKEIDSYRKRYYGLASYCDAQIGRLMEYIDNAGLRENTLIIFTSDHGHQLYDHGFSDKHNYYDESMRIPMIFSMPKTLPEGIKEKYAILNDLTASILAAANCEQSFVQGFDLFTPLKKGESLTRNHAVSTLYHSMAIVTDKYKLAYYLDNDEMAFYDRLNDPFEQENIAGVRCIEIQEKMKVALLKWRAAMSDIGYLKRNRHGGGPVAKRTSTLIDNAIANSNEIRLNEAIKSIEG